MLRGDIWKHFDLWLLGAVILANAFGVAMIRSAIAGNEVLAGLTLRQAIYVGLGLLLIIIIAALDYHYWSSLIVVIYVMTVVLLGVLFIVGQLTFGAVRWIETGLISIQPTEVAKIVAIIALGIFFEKTTEWKRDLRWIGLSFAVVGFLALFIFLQPNLSNVIVMMVIWGMMIWINGLKMEHVGVFALIAVTLIVIGVLLPFLRLNNINATVFSTFLFPDPNATHGAVYNVQQALISIGSGGLFGQGYGHGTQVQLRFLKVRHTDFIFSAVAEEFGLIGTVLVLLLLAFIVYRCLRAARMAKDVYGSMIAYGVAVLIFFQGSVNIAVNMNLIPVTGLPLPFISYGGSGLVSLMAGIGLVESVVLHHRDIGF